MSNRADRRRKMREETGRSKKLVGEYTKQQRIDALLKNGISPKDLDEAYDRGHRDGFREAALPIIKTCYAAICAALHDEFKFGEERCYRALRAVDEKVLYALTHEELEEEVYAKTGLQILWDEPFDRIQRGEKAKT